MCAAFDSDFTQSNPILLLSSLVHLPPTGNVNATYDQTESPAQVSREKIPKLLIVVKSIL